MAYTKTIWQIDDVITADKLNNIEEGIKSVEDNGLTIGTTASTAKAGNYQPTWAQVTGKPSTFDPIIGTTATTAKAGNYVPTWAEVSGKPATFPPTIGTTATTAKAGNYQPTTANISDASTIGKTILTASDATAVRTAIGAGTGNSNLAIGTTASTAAAGNHNHAITADVDSGLASAANLQAAFIALSARVKALEDAVVE